MMADAMGGSGTHLLESSIGSPVGLELGLRVGATRVAGRLSRHVQSCWVWWMFSMVCLRKEMEEVEGDYLFTPAYTPRG